jgi:hypothetical protein
MSFHRDMKGPALHAPSNEKIENNSGVTIQKLQVVSLDGHGTLFPQVVLANPNIRNNFGIAMQEIKDGNQGYVTCVGFMVKVNTSTWPVGTQLYSDANGNLVTTPIGNPVALVNKQDSSCGELYVIALGDSFGDAANPWLIDGNTGTDPDVNFLGTRDTKDLTFRTGNTQRFRIDKDGRFLLGDAAEQTPKYFVHLKQHGGFQGSGNMKETAAIEVEDTIFNNIYSFQVPDLSTVMGTFRIVALEDENTQQATFIRTATWFRQGGTAQLMGVIQSDYTNKSDLEFDLNFTRTGDTVFVNIKNANNKKTRWMITVELDIMINEAP